MEGTRRFVYNYPQTTKSKYHSFMRSLDTALGFDASQKAKFRLHCIEVSAGLGWKHFHQAFPNVSRTTLFRWRKKLEQSRRRLSSLVPQSTRPHRLRQMQVPPEILLFIRSARQQYPRMGKMKLRLLLDQFAMEHGLPTYSPTTIGKIIHRYSLYFQTSKRVRTTSRYLTKNYLKRTPRAKEIPLGYLQVDGVKIYYINGYLYFITAVEIVSRQAFAKHVPSFASKHTKDFLTDIIQMAPYQIHTIQTDNGSEFAGVFHEALTKLEMTHLFSRPRSPKTNAYVERFNYTIQDEFLNWNLDLVHEGRLEQELSKWLEYYNQVRPHQSLKYLTPMQYLTKLLSSS